MQPVAARYANIQPCLHVLHLLRAHLKLHMYASTIPATGPIYQGVALASTAQKIIFRIHSHLRPSRACTIQSKPWRFNQCLSGSDKGGSILLIKGCTGRGGSQGNQAVIRLACRSAQTFRAGVPVVPALHIPWARRRQHGNVLEDRQRNIP